MFNQRNFTEQLILKAMPDIEDDAIDLMIEDVLPVLQDRVFTHIASKLSDDELSQFVKLTETKSSQKTLMEFLNGKIENYESFIQSVYENFEKTYLSEHKKFQKLNQSQ